MEKKKRFLGKNVKLCMKNGDFFTGLVIEEEPKYILIKDKHGEIVRLDFETISILRIKERGF